MKQIRWHIILIDDDEDDYLLTRSMLDEARRGKFQLEWISSFEQGLTALLTLPCDAALIDYDIGTHTGVELIRAAVAEGCTAPMILLTGRSTYDVDVEAMQAGAADYINKREVHPALLERSIRYAIERRHNQKALRENELRAQHLAYEAQNNLQKLETVIDRMSEGVLLCDASGSLVRINPAAVALHGFQREEEMKRSLGDLAGLFEMSAADGQRIRMEDLPVTRALRGETVINAELCVRRRDNGKRWIGLYSAVPIQDARGELILVLNTITDITPLRQAEHQQHEMDARLQVQHLLVEQREQERLQIARDLHDGPIQELIGLMFTLQTAKNNVNGEETSRILSFASQEAEKLVSELRGVCNELRPPMLDKFGLAKAIQVHMENLTAQHSQPKFHLELDSIQGTLSHESRLALYRIYQESINNILRHAQASHVIVRLEIHEDHVQLTITDDGVGFLLPDDWLSLAREGHLGLVGIKERAEAIGADLELTSTPGAGTQVKVVLKDP